MQVTMNSSKKTHYQNSVNLEQAHRAESNQAVLKDLEVCRIFDEFFNQNNIDVDAIFNTKRGSLKIESRLESIDPILATFRREHWETHKKNKHFLEWLLNEKVPLNSKKQINQYDLLTLSDLFAQGKIASFMNIGYDLKQINSKLVQEVKHNFNSQSIHNLVQQGILSKKDYYLITASEREHIEITANTVHTLLKQEKIINFLSDIGVFPPEDFSTLLEYANIPDSYYALIKNVSVDLYANLNSSTLRLLVKEKEYFLEEILFLTHDERNKLKENIRISHNNDTPRKTEYYNSHDTASRFNFNHERTPYPFQQIRTSYYYPPAVNYLPNQHPLPHTNSYPAHTILNSPANFFTREKYVPIPSSRYYSSRFMSPNTPTGRY